MRPTDKAAADNSGTKVEREHHCDCVVAKRIDPESYPHHQDPLDPTDDGCINQKILPLHPFSCDIEL
jgi:hypothetical protein